MKLYISKDYKDKNELAGTIFNKAKQPKDEIYIRYKATRTSDTTFVLDLYHSKDGEHIEYQLEENFDCRMVVKDILFYVENRIEIIWRRFKGE